MEKFFKSFWNSVINSLDRLADNADVIFFVMIKILLIILVAKIIIWITGLVIRKLIRRRKKKSPDSLFAKKSETIAIVVQSVIRYAVYFFMIASILDQLDLGITAGSILATAGIGGIALCLGAQGLIKDIASGFFLLFENQFAIGDYVEVRDITGTVEAITVRTTQIRSWTGELIVIPNGTIDKVVNYTRGNVLAVVDVYIVRNEDLSKALQVMEESLKEYAASVQEIVEAPIIQGLAGLKEMGFELRAIIRVLPMTQWRVEREARLKVYEAFKIHGIDVPSPKRVEIETKK
jgi:small conductance mechanosensitive channel